MIFCVIYPFWSFSLQQDSFAGWDEKCKEQFMKVDAAMKTENLWHNLWQDRRIVWISWCLRLVESTSDVPPPLQLHWRWPLQGRSIVNLFQFTFQWKYLSTFLHSLVIYLIVESSCNRKQKLRFWHILYSRNSCVFRVCQYIQSFFIDSVQILIFWIMHLLNQGQLDSMASIIYYQHHLWCKLEIWHSLHCFYARYEMFKRKIDVLFISLSWK